MSDFPHFLVDTAETVIGVAAFFAIMWLLKKIGDLND